LRFRWIIFVALAVSCRLPAVDAQSSDPSNRSSTANPSSTRAADTGEPLNSFASYSPPTRKQLAHDYLFDVIGPYPIFTASASAGIHMATDSPPEWGGDALAFGRRFGSSFGIGTVETTTRYGLAAALKEDPMYYPCECRGILPRLHHAIFTSFTARRGADGHRVFSIPALAAPYAGTFTGTYGWYPKRFGVEDALRMGDNGFFSYVGGNIAIEFLEGGAHPLLSHLHIPVPKGRLQRRPGRR
jgi:hypothetical protein